MYEGVSQGAVSFLVRALTDKKTRFPHLLLPHPSSTCLSPPLAITLLQNWPCCPRSLFEIGWDFEWRQQHIVEVQVRRAYLHALLPSTLCTALTLQCGRHVGVVTVTGEGGDALLEASLDAGADDVAAAPEDGAWEVIARRYAHELCATDRFSTGLV